MYFKVIILQFDKTPSFLCSILLQGYKSAVSKVAVPDVTRAAVAILINHKFIRNKFDVSISYKG
jgi:hypothetical protein